MDSAEPPHVLDYYAKHYLPGMLDLSTSSPPGCEGPDGRMAYAAPGGLPELRAAIATLYPGLGPEHIVVANGASEALSATAFALVRPGQRVSAARAIYPSFREVAIRLGGVLVEDDAALLVVNNPTVPEGRLVDLGPLVASVEAAGAVLVADEVYLDLRPGAPGVPAASLSPAAISIGDLSKPLGLGGLRIGWAACRDQTVVAAIVRSVQVLSGGPSILAMGAALEAVNDYGPRMAARRAVAEANVPLVYDALESAGWNVRPPQAGWTFVAEPPEPPSAQQLRVMERAGLFFMPAAAFGRHEGFRISAFAPVDSLRLALRLLAAPSPGRGALVVLAKATGRGLGKTRLAAEVGEVAAGQLAEAFLEDTIELAQTSDRDVTIAYTPAECLPQFASLVPGASLVLQPDGDIGDRIAAALGKALKAQGPAAVLIGTDTPHLPRALLDEAFAALERLDLVVGPASDGGFYLLGARASSSLDGLFAGIEWSTPEVFGRLIGNGRRLGLTVGVLEELTDIDDAGSLGAALCQARRLGSGPRTLAAASRLELERP